jgi:serine/threonine protein kinase/Tol biopolymer transport system component
MGEVYRARDTRLDRTVAIKVLPAHLSTDPELKQRMEREAKAISALQHSNICTLYDIGEQDSTYFLVMEYLEGQTLADRLAKGPLPLEQVLKIGREVAEALEKAHQQGIIHRDLKPGNIMLTKAGAKLMDFGLAKSEVSIAAGGIGPLTPSTPTLMNIVSLTSAASPLTQKGAIVGTFQYMAPELLQGGTADARSDIFSFGCVLYEMVTGRRAFDGKSQLSVFTAILEKEPDPIGDNPSQAPALLEQVIRQCLVKDPVDRLQSAHDVALALGWMAESAPAESTKSSPRFRKTWAAGLAALLVSATALAGFAGYRWARSSEEPVTIRTQVAAPDKYSIDFTGDGGGMPVLSPQGDKIAFVAHSGDTKLLFVRALNSVSAQAIEGTTGASHPFWSPDGRFVGFFAGGKLVKVPAAGGPVAVVTDAPNARGGAWGANNVIVFAPDFNGGLLKVNAQGGTAEPATALDKTKHDTQRWPWFLPDGKHFIFLATSHNGSDAKHNGIYFGSVDGQENHLVVATDSSAQYAEGYLLYHVNTALVAQPFDAQSGVLSGSPIPVVTNLRDDLGVWRGIFAVSQNGVLIYQSGGVDSAKSHFVSYDLTGKVIADYDPYESHTSDTVGLLGVRDPRLSPDNQHVAFAGGTDIWTLDLARQTKTRITFDPFAVQNPDWSPDGKSLVFLGQVTNGGGNAEIRSKAADGSGAEKTLLQNPTDYHVPGLSPGGKYLTFLQGNGEKMVSLWIVPVSGDAKPVAIVQPPSQQSNLASYRVSPDSRWVAYQSDESGQMEVYITTFPEGKGKWRVSDKGGAYPAWSGSGKELFYKNMTDDFFRCAVSTKGDAIEVGTPQRLFHAATPGIGISFDAFSDGKRLLVNHAEEGSQAPLELVTNWMAELKK